MSTTSQMAGILRYLQSGRALTPLVALDRFGCLRLAARIEQLRRRHKIKTRMINVGKKKVASYSLRATS